GPGARRCGRGSPDLGPLCRGPTGRPLNRLPLSLDRKSFALEGMARGGGAGTIGPSFHSPGEEPSAEPSQCRLSRPMPNWEHERRRAPQAISRGVIMVRAPRKRSAFTLIELLVVIAIIGVL